MLYVYHLMEKIGTYHKTMFTWMKTVHFLLKLRGIYCLNSFIGCESTISLLKVNKLPCDNHVWLLNRTHQMGNPLSLVTVAGKTIPPVATSIFLL